MPTYVYLGHASDLLIPHETEPSSWVPWRMTIPAGCTYATISQSGETAKMASILNLNRLSSSPETKMMLMHPDVNYEDLSILTTGQDTNDEILQRGEYHFKTGGQPYTNRHTDFLLRFPLEGGSVKVYRSGLYNIEEGINPPLPTLTDDITIIPPEGVTIEVIKNIYAGSLFPTPEDVAQKIKEMMHMEDIAEKWFNLRLFNVGVLSEAIYQLVSNINQSELFQRYPGNHFNFACRSYDDGKNVKPEHLEQARLNSRRLLLERPKFNQAVAASRKRKLNKETEERVRANSEAYWIRYNMEKLRLSRFSEFIKGGKELSPGQKAGIIEIFRLLKTDIDSGTLSILGIPPDVKENIEFLSAHYPTLIKPYAGGKRIQTRVRRHKTRKTRKH